MATEAEIMGRLMKLNPFDRARDQLAHIEELGSPQDREGALMVMLAIVACVDLRRTKTARESAVKRAQDAFGYWNEVVLNPSRWAEPE